MNQKVITVRGEANVKVKPDYVNVLIDLVTQDESYPYAMEMAAKRIESLKDAMWKVKVDPEDLDASDSVTFTWELE